MKNIFLLFILFSVKYSYANNISITNVQLLGRNTKAGVNNPSNYIKIQFDISWENAWRTNGAPNNWDAAWIFIKFRVNGGSWRHAYLNNNGHFAPNGSTLENGLLNPRDSFNTNNNPVVGVFLYLDTIKSGNFQKNGVQLRWNYGASGVDDNATIDIKVLAFEMVYVPNGSFYVGSGGYESSSFYTYPNTTTPYGICSEQPIPVSSSEGNLYYNTYNSNGINNQNFIVPSAYPKGFFPFYCMKYEITQQQYVNFLNSITQIQAISRFPNKTTFRHTISKSTIGELYTTSLPNVACNFLSWADIAAYLDWSGLRPMSEFEFEKVCRGPKIPVPNEYAWGNTNVFGVSNIINSGLSNETAILANAAVNLDKIGPMRIGAFATTTSNRESSGAGYYGILELSGNLFERTVSIADSIGRGFKGTMGDGNLTISGFSDNQDWPNINANGIIERGGNFTFNTKYLRVSDRVSLNNGNQSTFEGCGGRGVRTSLISLSPNDSVSITSLGATSTICKNSNQSSVSLPYIATTGNPVFFSIDWELIANANGLIDQDKTSFNFQSNGGIITGINFIVDMPAGKYNGIMTISDVSGSSTTLLISTTVIENIVGTISMESSNICLGTSTTISMSSIDGQIQWQQSLDSTIGWINVIGGDGANKLSYTTPGLLVNTYYRAVISKNYCSPKFSNISAILVYPNVSKSGNVSVTSPVICMGTKTTLILANSYGNVQWQQSTDGVTSWINVVGGTGSNSTAYITPNLQSNIYYRAAVSIGNCAATYSNVVSVEVNSSNSKGGTATASTASICLGTNTSISLSNYVGIIQWQQSANGNSGWVNVVGGSNGISSTYTTASLTSNMFFRAAVTNCSMTTDYSNTVAITMNTSTSLSGTAAVSAPTICSGNSTAITLNNSRGNIQWQQSVNGTSNWVNVTSGSGANTSTYNTSNLTTKTYYRAVVTNCAYASATSNIVSISINNSIGGTANAIDTVVCTDNATTTISITGNTGTIQWQQSLDGVNNWEKIIGVSCTTCSSFVTPQLSNKIYYRAIVTNGSCMSVNSSIVAVRVKENPTVIATYPAKRTGSGIVTLSATPSAGNLNWYSTFSGGSILSTGNSFTTPMIYNTVTYFVEASLNGCKSKIRKGVTAIVNPEILDSTIKIGTQIWLNKNLDVFTYRNGDSIFQIQSDSIWRKTVEGAWCNYDNDKENYAAYGKLYNGYAVNDKRSICPINFHVPSMNEWTILINYLGFGATGSQIQAISGWSNTSTNNTRFSALPFGIRNEWGGFQFASKPEAYWWSASPYLFSSAYIFSLSDEIPRIFGASEYNKGHSVRCIKDTLGITTGGGLQAVCYSKMAQTSSLEYNAVTNSPSAFSIDWDDQANKVGFKDKMKTAYLFSYNGGTLDNIEIPADVMPERYNGNLTIFDNSGNQFVQPISLLVNPIPTIISTTPVSKTGAGSVELKATADNGEVNWYNTATGGAALWKGDKYIAHYLFNTETFYVDAAYNGYTTSFRQPVMATINKIASDSLVTIGNQIWMGKNLDVSTFRNGEGIALDTIPTITNWERFQSPLYCIYDNRKANDSIYGKLYNWYAMKGAICPIGFHVPTYKEWDDLIQYLGGYQTAGKEMKSIKGWTNNGNGTNNSTFNALPSGSFYKQFYGLGSSSAWWISNPLDFQSSTIYLQDTNNSILAYNLENSHGEGKSIRCIKD